MNPLFVWGAQWKSPRSLLLGELPEGAQREPDPDAELWANGTSDRGEDPDAGFCQFAHRCSQRVTLILDAGTKAKF